MQAHHGEAVVDVEIWPAVIAGFIAGAIMEGPVYLQKALGLPVKQNIFRTWGLMFDKRGAAGYVVGIVFHQLLAVVIAIGYALFFRLVGVESNLWLWGAVGALIHYTLAGPVVKFITPSVCYSRVRTAAGPAARRRGRVLLAARRISYSARARLASCRSPERGRRGVHGAHRAPADLR